MKSGTIRSVVNANWFTVAPGIWGLRDAFVNVYFIHNAVEKKWILVDAGLKRTASKIKQLADSLFWPESTPAAIILTHGHFDHVGSVLELAREWDVPVFAHLMELPYLSGLSAYPPPDPWAGGGLMSVVSPAFPKGPINISDHIQLLPDDGSLPFLPDWKYIHTPGHSPGHISLFRKRDKVLLAGDAVVTTRQESVWSVMMQTRVLTGPPRYFTCDWKAAARSVKALAALEPETVATGHGQPMKGEQMRKMLHKLAENFRELAVPSHGRYSREAAITDAGGVTYVPRQVSRITPGVAVAAGVAVLALTAWLVYQGRKSNVLAS
ncbi:MBL fold metallo-hydrolase [Niastella caeni]|uniref:MBL fold metallo-hydrolase n=1 Tax=Niastella caeni TaxID=2569763 RepID=A0A4S8HL34_9BACT|nr:MBL fold metallo-hydrolase [Niastella caeni]THU35865.1 MBL fold metallo-hydrolase [Niastella caeni]